MRGWSKPAGPTLAPRLLAAVGSQRDKYALANRLQCFSGIAPVLKQSGQSHHVHSVTAVQSSCARASTNTPAQASNASGPLFPDDELHNLRARWDQAQTSFVDEPRRAVEQADSLVANVVTRIAEQFSNERAKLEEQWSKGDNVSTEDLRQALRRYRSFFDRLLSF